jgi:hypothetical protein
MLVLWVNKFSSVWYQASTAKQMRHALFWVITQRVVIISCPRFGTSYRSHFQGCDPKSCPEKSVGNCRYSMRDNAEDRSSKISLRSWRKDSPRFASSLLLPSKCFYCSNSVFIQKLLACGDHIIMCTDIPFQKLNEKEACNCYIISGHS